mmetsp:Transcript_21422/g.45286  ORF Transcript_21422/g.45286 Transcript_21422/m.45286 type:complete len:107 (-) Transcript_21422:324-644(-)
MRSRADSRADSRGAEVADRVLLGDASESTASTPLPAFLGETMPPVVAGPLELLTSGVPQYPQKDPWPLCGCCPWIATTQTAMVAFAVNDATETAWGRKTKDALPSS